MIGLWKTKYKSDKHIPDWNTKFLQKRLQRPYFSPEFDSWEMDIMFVYTPNAERKYLFCININTKFLVAITIPNKKQEEIKKALIDLVRLHPVASIRGDSEKGFNTTMLNQFFHDNHIKTYFTSERFINRNRVVDRVMRTIRDGFGMRVADMRD